MTLIENEDISSEKNGHSMTEIAKDVERAPSTISKFIKKSETRNLLSLYIKIKADLKKESTVLDNEQKSLLEKWLKSREAKSSHETWIRLCNVKNTKKVYFNAVNNYIKSLGQWKNSVQWKNPLLETVLSAANKGEKIRAL